MVHLDNTPQIGATLVLDNNVLEIQTTKEFIPSKWWVQPKNLRKEQQVEVCRIKSERLSCKKNCYSQSNQSGYNCRNKILYIAVISR